MTLSMANHRTVILDGWLVTTWQARWCCVVQAAVIIVYSVLLTAIDASFWLHPFGPLTKNLPLLVLILWVYRSRAHRSTDTTR
ncbi:MAG: DoxX-like family protein [Pseudomonadota bacterium]